MAESTGATRLDRIVSSGRATQEQPAKVRSSDQAFGELEQAVYAALQRYSNVHRGTGHNSIISTALYEHARDVVLAHLALDESHVALFLTPWKLQGFLASLKPGTVFHVLSSRQLGLSLGVSAVALRRHDLPRGVPYQTGGGTIKMVSPRLIAWADIPDLFEPGTPNIVGAIAFARALRQAERDGDDIFRARSHEHHEPADILYSDELMGLESTRLLERLRQTLVGNDVLVPTETGRKPYVNFDNGASTPTFEPVWEAFRRTLRLPVSTQMLVVEEVTAVCREFFGAPESSYDVIYAANTTEAVNIAARNARLAADREPGTVVMNTMLEHNSDELPWRHCPGIEQVRVDVDREGFIDLVQMERTLRAYNEELAHGHKRIRLVCVCGASNVMGTYNDIPAISRIVHRYDAKLLVDAAQLAAHRPVNMQRDDIDFLAFSAHKMYAPFGSGGLVARRSLLRFGPDELSTIRASGEQNAAGIAALGKAMVLLRRIGFDAIMEKERKLTCRALEGMAGIPGMKIYGVSNECSEHFARKGGVICFEFARTPHNLAARLIAEHGGVGVRCGCFCVNMYVKQLLGIGPVKNGVAHVGLKVLPGLMGKLLVGLVRVSFGIANSLPEVDRLIAALEAVAGRKESRLDRILAGLHFGTTTAPDTTTGMDIRTSVYRTLHRAYSTHRPTNQN